MIAVKKNPALDAGSRPATEARADSEPPACPTALLYAANERFAPNCRHTAASHQVARRAMKDVLHCKKLACKTPRSQQGCDHRTPVPRRKSSAL
jgi:hypothetical protein